MENLANTIPTVSKLSHFYYYIWYDTIYKLQFKYNKYAFSYVTSSSDTLRNTDTNIRCKKRLTH